LIRISSSFTGWLVAGMVVLGPAFLNRWVGLEVGSTSQWVIVFLAAAMFMQVVSSQVPLAFYQSLHLVAFPAAVLSFEALLNLGLSIWLAPRMGVNGVALATVIPAFAISGAILPAYLGRHLNVPLPTLIGTGFAPGVLMMVVTGATLWASGMAIDSTSYAGILGRALTSVPAAAVAVVLGFPRGELQVIAGAFGSARGDRG
jgi:O-antigen/teichoic acid export membrane protein